MHLFDAMNNEFHTLIEGDPETGHTGISDSDFAALALLLENGDHAAPAAHHVAVTGATETSILRPGIGIGLHEHFLGAQLGCTVKINRVDRFVGAEGENAAHTLVDGGVDHISATHDVGLNGFEGIVFTRGHLFERGRVHDHCDAGKCAT